MDLMTVEQSFLSERMSQERSELTFQVILQDFYRPAFVILNNCNIKHVNVNVSSQEEMLGVCQKRQSPGLCHFTTHGYIHFITHAVKCHNGYLYILFPGALRWVQCGSTAVMFVSMGRTWAIPVQLYLQPHTVLKERISLVSVQTCHSLVLAGVICCNWITGF